MSEQEKKPTFVNEVISFVKMLAIAIIIVFIITNFLFRPIQVHGDSMYPTLYDQSLGVSNILSAKNGDINRFDVVVIYLADQKEYLIKRVIGLPNDTIEYKNSTLLVNGEAVVESFLDVNYTSTFDTFTEDFGPIVLEDDQYFCLGDNRPYSKDSRFYGPFLSSQIKSKGAYIFFPFNHMKAVD